VARRGLFGRTLNWLSGHLPGRPEAPSQPPREPPRQPPPPPGREPPERTGGGGESDPFRREWNADVPRSTITRIQDATGYSRNEIFQAHYELFVSLPGVVEDDRQEQLRLWDIYINSLVVDHGQRRNDLSNPFWSEFGLDPRQADFEWDEWRNAMGYSRRGK
jgi:hypothetical protein